MTSAPINHISQDERGVAYVAGSRIKVRHLAVEHEVWKKPAEAIQREYPSLSLGQIFAALAYYCDHKREIDAEIAEEERLTDLILSRQEPRPSKEQLLARLNDQTNGDAP